MAKKNPKVGAINKIKRPPLIPRAVKNAMWNFVVEIWYNREEASKHKKH